jgi:hypothetical protein
MSTAKFYVYVYRHPITKIPFYVGKGSGQRIWKHLYETYENTENRKKYAVIKNILSRGLKPLIGRYAKNLDEDAAYTIEERLIAKWGRRDIDPDGILTNICATNRPPSNKGRVCSAETKRKLAEAKLGSKNPMFGRRGPDAPMYGRRLTGEANGFYGKTHTEENRKKFAENSAKLHKGRKRSEETKIKMRIARQRQVITEETKKKLSLANLGKKQSPETIEKRRATQIGRSRPSKKLEWILTDIQGNEFRTNSLKAFCMSNDLDENSVRKVENRDRYCKEGYNVRKIKIG